jgi:hypothetical protein
MNQDDIIRVAREAGFAEWYGTDDPQFLIVIEHFAALVAAHEREECLEELIVDYEKPIHKELPDVRAAGCSQAQGQQNRKCEAGPSLQDLWDCWDAVHGGQKPTAWMSPTGDNIVHVRNVGYTPNWTDYYTIPLYLYPTPIPEGWQLVPEEPTLEMEQAAWRANAVLGRGMVDVYKAMLVAAPKYEEQSK